MFLVGDDNRRLAGDGSNALPRGLQHGVVADERQELLRIHLARQRPETGAGAAGEDHGNNRQHVVSS